MRYHAADFLTGLFDSTVMGLVGPGPEARTPTAAADGPAPDGASPGQTDASGEPADWPAPDAPDFSGWVLRPDATGRLGWEPADLPEDERLWLDRLPERDERMPGVVAIGDAPSFPADDAPLSGCPRCGTLELWWDLLGGVHCQRCDREAFQRAGCCATGEAVGGQHQPAVRCRLQT